MALPRSLLAGAALPLLGCLAFDELTQGPALWPFLLGTEVHLEDHAMFRTTKLVVCLGEVGETFELETLPVGEAEVTLVDPDGGRLELVELDAGLYATTDPMAQLLTYRVGEVYTVEARFDGRLVRASAPAAPLLDATIPLSWHPRGEPLLLPLPEGYADDYDQVLVQVTDEHGDETFSTLPQTFEDWLDFGSRRHTPAEVVVPGEAFPRRDTLYGVAVLGVVRSRKEAEFSENLASAFSGFTTGSGFAIPVRTAP